MTNRLQWEVFVSAQIPAVAKDVALGTSGMKWSPISSTLISGKRDAVLVDTAITIDQNQKLVDWIAASGKNLTTIYVTHGHGDHFFGAAPVLGRFHDAKMVATPAVVKGMKKQLSPAWLDGFWRARFPAQLPDRLFVA